MGFTTCSLTCACGHLQWRAPTSGWTSPPLLGRVYADSRSPSTPTRRHPLLRPHHASPSAVRVLFRQSQTRERMTMWVARVLPGDRATPFSWTRPPSSGCVSVDGNEQITQLWWPATVGSLRLSSHHRLTMKATPTTPLTRRSKGVWLFPAKFRRFRKKRRL